MASSRNLVSTIGALASPKWGTEPGVRKGKEGHIALHMSVGRSVGPSVGMSVSLNLVQLITQEGFAPEASNLVGR